MNNYDLFKRIVHSSKEFKFRGTVLELRDYYTGESVSLDLSKLDEDVFEEIEYREDEEEEYE